MLTSNNNLNKLNGFFGTAIETLCFRQTFNNIKY